MRLLGVMMTGVAAVCGGLYVGTINPVTEATALLIGLAGLCVYLVGSFIAIWSK